MTDIRAWNIAGEIARLEAALAGEREALRQAPDPQARQTLRRNLAAGHEALGALYRRLHALGADAAPAADTLLWVGEVPAVVHR